jgi:hypothetical protein
VEIIVVTVSHPPSLHRLLRSACLGLTLAFAAAQADASVLVIDRGLPTANLNNAAGSDRSNVSWDFQGYGWIAGDDFTVPTAEPGHTKWRIDTIRTWVVAGTTGGLAAANNDNDTGNDNVYALGDTFASLSLYLGRGSTLDNVSTGVFAGAGSNATDNANISISRVQYSSAESQFDYQGSSTNFIQMFEVEFTNLGLLVDPGEMINFAVDGLGAGDTPDPDTFTLFLNHASNAGLSGSTQDGSDDLYKAYYLDGPGATLWGSLDSDGYGWDKSSDINIQVFATAEVPAPAPLALFGLGLLALGMQRRFTRV